MKPAKRAAATDHARTGPRIQSLRKISFNYEGQSEHLEIRPPDVSSRGMFIATNRAFPEGAVLKLVFRLTLTGAEIEARGEVRYCLAGVGVGVEFLDLAPKAAQKIEQETKLWSQRGPRRDLKKRKRRA
jgi:hypothetical protein